MKHFKWLSFAFVLIIFSGMLNHSYSQSIYFCEGVDDDGQPINESSVFTIPEGGGYLYVLIQLPYEIDCKEIDLEIYRNDSYDTTITINTERNWTWFWKKVTFYKSGDFDIDVYDCNDEYIISGSVTIEME
ncbi:MAG: hypothetical protein ROY99_13210 [Ignavibacterium sp.]|jgi:hypothetical protein|nr:hypothetical protein [Ignavibacterium sp.]